MYDEDEVDDDHDDGNDHHGLQHNLKSGVYIFLGFS